MLKTRFCTVFIILVVTLIIIHEEHPRFDAVSKKLCTTLIGQIYANIIVAKLTAYINNRTVYTPTPSYPCRTKILPKSTTLVSNIVNIVNRVASLAINTLCVALGFVCSASNYSSSLSDVPRTPPAGYYSNSFMLIPQCSRVAYRPPAIVGSSKSQRGWQEEGKYRRP